MKLATLGEPVPGTTNLYAWEGDQVLKLYGEDAPPDGVAYVGRVDRALYEAGLPVPAVGELIEIEGRLGQVYERIEGPSIAEALFEAGDASPRRIIELAHVFAEVHALIHACGPIDGFATQQVGLAQAIERADPLPDDLRQAALMALASMPAGDQLCHGDYHPLNVLLSPQGPVVIDWPNGHIGNPVEDVARSALILEGVAVSQPEMGAVADQFRRAYLDHYFDIRPGGRGQLVAWKPIVAAVRLTDRIPELEEWLLETIRCNLGG